MHNIYAENEDIDFETSVLIVPFFLHATSSSVDFVYSSRQLFEFVRILSTYAVYLSLVLPYLQRSDTIGYRVTAYKYIEESRVNF